MYCNEINIKFPFCSWHCSSMAACKQRQQPNMKTKQRCQICNVYYPISSISRHIKIHSTRKKLKCSHCSSKCIDEFLLRLHVKYTHMKPERVKCPVCNIQIAKGYSMMRHMKLHLRSKFSCHKCNARYSAKSSLLNHIKIRHTSDEKEQCPTCKKHFSVLSISRHIKSHSYRKWIKCG